MTPLFLLLAFAAAADPDYAKELPRIPPTEPADALKTFVLKSGYRLEQVAAEPLVASPVAVAWDENSRLYVVEMRGYSEDRGEKLSRVKRLESTKGDGVYDKATVFADGLLWPTAVAWWDGGVFVGDAPHVYYLKDTDGDGKADVKKVVFTGFGTHNVQGLLNSFQWTLDNRIHGATGTCGGSVTKPDDPAFQPLNLNGRDFDFDPRTLDLRATSGGGQHGLTFDDRGHKFVSSNSDHIQQVMYEDRYVARNPYLVPPPPRVSIASDGPQAEVFPAAAVEPWRAVRTRLRVQGVVPGVVEGGGRASGYFTGATGVTIYRGDAAPDLSGQAFIGDACSSLVHRKQLTLPAGSVQYRADRVDTAGEFLASKDNWFRPVQFANGPDGCLTIIDMYRETIEHPASLPPAIKKHLDLTSGRDRGRLYRVLPEDHTPRQLPKLGGLKTWELVRLLDHPNAWHRETAGRLLYERRDKAAVGPLVNMHESLHVVSDLGHMHVLYALHGLGELKPQHVWEAIHSKHAPVREHAWRLGGAAMPDVLHTLLKMDSFDREPDAEVRYQLLFAHGEMSAWGFYDPVRGTRGDPWARLALLSTFRPENDANTPGSILFAFDPATPKTRVERLVMSDLATLISRRDDEKEVRLLVMTLDRLKGSARNADLIPPLMKAVRAGGGPKARAAVAQAVDADLIARLLKAAAETAANGKLPTAARVEAVQTLSLGRIAAVRDSLVALLDPKQPGEVQLAALGVLDGFNEPTLPDTLLKRWPTLSPRLRAAAGETLLARPARVTAVLDAVEKKAFDPRTLDATQIKRLTKDKRGATLLAAFQPARRPDVLAKYRPALDATGDAAKGKAIFAKTCAACHKLEGVGTELGPNLSAMKNRGAEAILTNVLDPNAEVNPQYVSYTANLTDGRTVTGVIAAETATSVTFVRGEGLKDVVPRADVESLKSTGLSLMPEGLEKDISVEAMADLIAYLMAVP